MHIVRGRVVLMLLINVCMYVYFRNSLFFSFTFKSYIIIVIYYISYSICTICHSLVLLTCTKNI